MTFEEIMQPYLEKYSINEMKFHFDDSLNSYISNESLYHKDEEVQMIIKMIDNVGTVLIGISPDGERFIEYDYLGQIVKTNIGWVNV